MKVTEVWQKLSEFVIYANKVARDSQLNDNSPIRSVGRRLCKCACDAANGTMRWRGALTRRRNQGGYEIFIALRLDDDIISDFRIPNAS